MSENGQHPQNAEAPQLFIPDGAKNAALIQRNEKLRADIDEERAKRRQVEDNADFIHAALISEQHKAMMLAEENARLCAVLDRHGIDPNEKAEPATVEGGD